MEKAGKGDPEDAVVKKNCKGEGCVDGFAVQKKKDCKGKGCLKKMQAEMNEGSLES